MKAQQQMVEFDLDFRFDDGIYLGFQDFRNNNPIPITHIISNHDIRLPDYMEQVTDADFITYFDPHGEQRSVATNDVWGYAFNGKAFIQYGDGFFRMPMMGTITHFTAAVTTYRMMSDPMMMNPGMMPYREVPVQELRQFVLDMRSGVVVTYTEDNVLKMMGSEPDLIDAFLAQRKKQRQQSLMLYIRKHNDRYPLYFPE